MDLTIQIDANEELRVEEEEGKANLMVSDLDPMMDNSDLPFLDGILSSPHIDMEKRQSIQFSMIGEIKQFNKLKDSFARRFTEK